MLKEIIQQIKLAAEPCKKWIERKTKPLHLQILGYAATQGVYILAAILKLMGVLVPGELLWIILLLLAGLPEILLILVFRKTITRFGRELLPKWLDTTIIIARFPVTWWIFGPLFAAIGLVHYLDGHYGEKQPK